MLSSNDEKTEQLQSALAACVVRGVLSYSDLHGGSAILLSRVDDFALDFPSASQLLGALLAHLCHDEVLDDAILEPASGSAGAEAARAHARALLSSPLSSPLAQMRAIFRDVVVGYMNSGDLEALEGELASLHARHTLHEAVRKVVQYTLTSGPAASSAAAGGPAGSPSASSASGGSASPPPAPSQDPVVLETASDLLARLRGSGFLPEHAAVEGFLRVLRSTADFAADEPAAAQIVPRFVARAIADGVLPPSFLADARAAISGWAGSGNAAPASGSAPLSPPRHHRYGGAGEVTRSYSGPEGGFTVASPASGSSEQPAASSGGGGMDVEDGDDSAYASRVASAALEAVSAAGALLEGAVPPTAEAAGAARLAGVWGYGGRPLPQLRSDIEALVKATLTPPPVAAAAAAGGATPAFPTAEAAGEAFARSLAPLAAPAPRLHAMHQAEVAYALLYSAAAKLGGAAEDDARHIGTVALSGIDAAVGAGVVSAPAAARAFARTLQALEETALTDAQADQDGALLDAAWFPALAPWLHAVCASLRGAGARSVDFLSHPSPTLSRLLQQVSLVHIAPFRAY